jgi:hypothetical protein
VLPSIALVDSIDARLKELHREIAQLEAARAALGPTQKRRRTTTKRPTKGENALAAARSPRRNAARKASRARRAISAPPIATDTLEQLLSGTDGVATATLAQRANARTDAVLAGLKELEAAGRVRRTGQRRSTRWRLITDEDRIQERAAELDAQRRAVA